MDGVGKELKSRDRAGLLGKGQRWVNPRIKGEILRGVYPGGLDPSPTGVTRAPKLGSVFMLRGARFCDALITANMIKYEVEDHELQALKGRVILIIGAATGIGRATVLLAHRKGDALNPDSKF